MNQMGNSRSSEENNKSWDLSPNKTSEEEKRKLILSTIRPSVASNDTNSNTHHSSKEVVSKQEMLAEQLNMFHKERMGGLSVEGSRMSQNVKVKQRNS